MKLFESKFVGNFLKLALLIMSLGPFGPVLASRDEAAVVYFFPFEIDTYIPITTATIESTATQKWITEDRSQVNRLLSIIDHGTQATFENVNVRAAVVIGDRYYYLNRDGVVKNGDRNYKIDMHSFWKFRASLDERQMHSVF